MGGRAGEVPSMICSRLSNPQSDDCHHDYDHDDDLCDDDKDDYLDTVVLGGATQREVESGPGKIEELL